MPIRSAAVALVGALLALPALAEPNARVVLLPIAVHATGSDSEYLQKGLAEMLSARLEQFEGLVVVRPGDAAMPASGRQEALDRGREAGADFVLYGSFTRFGEGASLDLRCDQLLPPTEDPEAEVSQPPARQVFIQAGTLAEIIPDLDTLAEKVARFAITAPAGPQRRALARASGNGAPAGGASGAEVQEILRRLDALERTVYAPLAQGEAPAGDEATPDAATSLVR